MNVNPQNGNVDSIGAGQSMRDRRNSKNNENSGHNRQGSLLHQFTSNLPKLKTNQNSDNPPKKGKQPKSVTGKKYKGNNNRVF